MADYPDPAYDLSQVQEMARAGSFHIRRKALDGAAELDLDRHDILDCILGLEANDFHKSMDAGTRLWAGCRQDVYKPTYNRIQLYVKLQYWPEKRLYIVSFKRK